MVEDGAKIGDNVFLYGQVYVGRDAQIGQGSILYPQVVLREEVVIGKNCILHVGAVIGSDGFGYYFSDGKHNKIPQIGEDISPNLGLYCCQD